MRETAIHLAAVSLLLGFVLFPYLAYGGLALASLWALNRTWLVLNLIPYDSPKAQLIMAFIAYAFMKVIVRGCGTVFGLLELGVLCLSKMILAFYSR